MIFFYDMNFLLDKETIFHFNEIQLYDLREDLCILNNDTICKTVLPNRSMFSGVELGSSFG